MDRSMLIERLKDKKQLDVLVSEVMEEQSKLSDLFQIIENEKSSVKFSCTKIIRLVSELKPEKVYPYFDNVVGLLKSDNSFIKWDGITILANLVKVDNDLKFDMIYDEYFGLIQEQKMITAATVVGNAWKIAMAKPDREADITKRMLSVPKNVYYIHGEPSPECNNILCGHVMDCLEKYYQASGLKTDIRAFLMKQQNNSRNSVARKAEKLLKKIGS